MRSLPIPRDRLPHLAAWLLVVLLVVAVQVMTLPASFRSAGELAEVPTADRKVVREALAAIHLTQTHLAWYWLAGFGITAVVYLAMGWLLVSRGRPVVFSTWLAIVMVALTSAWYPPAIDDLLPGRPVLQILVLGLTVVAVSGFFILPLVFPDGRFVPRWTMLLVVYILASIASLGVTNAMLEGASGVIFEVVTTIGFALILIGSAVYRYRRVSSLEQRRQTRWVLLGFMIGLPAFFIADAMMRNIDGTPMGIFFLFGYMVLIQIGFNAPFVAVGSAILFHHLFDIDVIVGRTIVWILMTLVVIGAYIGIVLGFGNLVDAERSLPLSLLATGLVAVAFQPLHARVRRAVNRLLFGERDDPYAVMSRLGHHIGDASAVADLLPQIVRTTAEALRLPYVALFLDRVTGTELVASAGAASARTTPFPLMYQGHAIGRLEVAQRSPGEPFSAADNRLLDDLARQIGVAAQTVSLADDLQRSRERIVTSREEERRRLRRDLHDGLGAQLAALIMQAGAVRTLVRSDPEGAERELQELRDELRGAVGEVRRLVQGLRPPALDELGLAGALHARLGRLQRAADVDEGSLTVEYNVDETLPPLGAAVEVAAFRIVDEAVTNILRHANARNARISLQFGADGLVLEVEDDGASIGDGSGGMGMGLHSMRERASELGGSFSVGAGPGGIGTRVRAVLPVEATA